MDYLGFGDACGPCDFEVWNNVETILDTCCIGTSHGVRDWPSCVLSTYPFFWITQSIMDRWTSGRCGWNECAAEDCLWNCTLSCRTDISSGRLTFSSSPTAGPDSVLQTDTRRRSLLLHTRHTTQINSTSFILLSNQNSGTLLNSSTPCWEVLLSYS